LFKQLFWKIKIQQQSAVERPSREESSQSHRILKGQLPRTAQNVPKSRKGMVNTIAVNMDITLHTLQQTATQLKIGPKPRITLQRPTKCSFSNQNLRKEINLLAKIFWRCMLLSSRESKPS
jgi:hypothetical protein